MIDESDPQFGEAVTLFKNKYGDSLPKVFRDNPSYRKIESFVVFAEYIGENSFAGIHQPTDIKDVILFDIPDIIYEGIYTTDFVDRIRNNEDNLKEGVIVKGVIKEKRKSDEVWMVKVKTLEWLNKVKSRYGEKALLSEVNGYKNIFNSI